jgi:MOSC domain-containing protein YiiM
MSPPPTVVSINTGPIQPLERNGSVVHTAIIKTPVTGPVRVRALGIDGDQQAEKRHHGGVHMAVYAYTVENYDFWRHELGDPALPFARFGENLTIAGIDEADVCIGDRFRVGDEVEVEVTSPRGPCSKLGMVMGDATFPKRFLASGRVGFYLRVLSEGMFQTGDRVERTHRDPARVSIADIVRLRHFDKSDVDAIKRAAAIEALGPKWRAALQKAAGVE